MPRRKRNIGRMRHLVTIKNVVRTEDDGGGFARADTDGDSVWADIQPLSASEVFRYKSLDQEITHVLVTRAHSGIKQGVTITYGSRSFYVLTVVDEDELGEFYRVMAREGGNL